MPTGPLHRKAVTIVVDDDGLEYTGETVPCRCMIGVDHNADDVRYMDEYDFDSMVGDDDECDTDETLSASDAALIWGSSGMDEDYTFGYSEDELRDAM